MVEQFNNSSENNGKLTIELLEENEKKEEIAKFTEEVNSLESAIVDVYWKLKDFNFGSILTFNKWVQFKDNIKKTDEKWNYIELNGIKFYDTNDAQSQGKLPDNWFVYYMSWNLLFLSAFKDWKFVWDWLQINRDKDITKVTNTYN